MMKNEFNSALDMIKKADNILVFAHQSPDGDAIGSMCAVGQGLKKLGKNVDYIAGENRYSLEKIIDEMKYFNKNIKDHYELALVVDSSTVDYIHANEYLKICDNILVFDHHDTNTYYADVNVVDSSAAACGEIIYKFLNFADIEIDKSIAECIFTAIVTDTGNFVYSNTTADSHRIVAELYDKYDDFYIIAEFLKLKPIESVKMLSIGLGNLHMYQNGRFIVSVLSYADGFSESLNKNTDTLTDVIRYVHGVDVAVVARQINVDTYKCSMRSSEEKYDVSEFCFANGGGGHKKAAGFNFTGSEDKLLKLLEEYFSSL